MSTSYARARRAAAVGGATLALIAGAAPAEAGFLDSLEPTVGSVLTPLVDTVNGIVGEVNGIVGELVPTGWLYDGTVTTMSDVRAAIGAESLWRRGYDGTGIGVALIDTGVVPVDGLRGGNVRNGADLSFESQSPELRYYDTFGHGAHMAGIIAGNEPRASVATGERFIGVAPGARLTSVKTAASDGGVDVSQVVAAVDWVVEHRNDNPSNPIRVLNLSYGTDGVQDYRVDPLTHAVENAWRAGIVVVVSGGNNGVGSGKLNNPAYDPHVITVGAADTRGTALQSDDLVPAFSSRGDASRRVDVTAPGRSIASLRVPGSYLDSAHPDARYGDELFKGSGSSQAAAVVSGAVALLLDQRPTMTPDQVKALLRNTASAMPLADAEGRGAGEVNVAAASSAKVPSAKQGWTRSAGTGSLEAARGSQHVADGEVELTGERDILGPWSAAKWANASSSGSSWVGGKFMGRDWTGGCWCNSTWTGTTWSGRSWSGRSWSGEAWSGRSWSGRSWSGRSWSGEAWAGRSWSGRSWSGRSWS
jgi:serine protease AprX